MWRKEVEISIRTLTPIWTGGAAGTCDRIHETGIIGSLRWWYEAIVRGTEGKACDPTTEDPRCRYDLKKYQESTADDGRQRLRDAGLCDACQVFGASGWKRRFQLEIEDSTEPAWTPPIPMNIRPPRRNRGWYLMPGRIGDLVLRFRGDKSVLVKLASLFTFLERWGNLGSRPQLGYGLFEILNRSDLVAKKNDFRWPSWSPEEANKYLPDLREFILFHYIFQPCSTSWWQHVPGIAIALGDHKNVPGLNRLHSRQMVPITPDFRNQWRFENGGFSESFLRWIFGISTVDRKTQEFDRVRSKYAVSWAYHKEEQWHIRGWVWLPTRDDQRELTAQERERAKEVIVNKDTFEALVGVAGVLETRSGLEALHDS